MAKIKVAIYKSGKPGSDDERMKIAKATKVDSFEEKYLTDRGMRFVEIQEEALDYYRKILRAYDVVQWDLFRLWRDALPEKNESDKKKRIEHYEHFIEEMEKDNSENDFGMS